ncbi:hypothetical protein BGZ73_007330, partial [Actinomortierella ambigua]
PVYNRSGTDISLDVILDYREIRFDNSAGLLLGFAWLLNACVGVYLLLRIVARARLVLDFSLTLLLYHVIMTTLYSDHLPTSFLWWGLNATMAGIMIFGGEFVCMRQEMEPILLGGGGGSTGQDGVRSGASGTGTAIRTTHHARTRSNGSGAMMTAGVSASSSNATTSNTALGFIQSQTKQGRAAAGGGGRYDTTGDREESAGLLMMDSLDHLHHELAHSSGGPGATLSSSAATATGTSTGTGAGGDGVYGSPSPQPQGSSSMMTLPNKAK